MAGFPKVSPTSQSFLPENFSAHGAEFKLSSLRLSVELMAIQILALDRNLKWALKGSRLEDRRVQRARGVHPLIWRLKEQNQWNANQSEEEGGPVSAASSEMNFLSWRCADLSLRWWANGRALQRGFMTCTRWGSVHSSSSCSQPRSTHTFALGLLIVMIYDPVTVILYWLWD